MINSIPHFAVPYFSLAWPQTYRRFANASQFCAAYECSVNANDEINLLKINNLCTIPFIFLWILQMMHMR